MALQAPPPLFKPSPAIHDPVTPVAKEKPAAKFPPAGVVLQERPAGAPDFNVENLHATTARAIRRPSGPQRVHNFTISDVDNLHGSTARPAGPQKVHNFTISTSTSPSSEIGIDQQIHILQGQLQKLSDRLDALHADMSHNRRLLVQLSNHFTGFHLEQAEHTQQVRNFMVEVHRAVAAYIRYTDP